LKNIKNVINTVVKPTITILKKAAPYIGAAAGGVIGLIAGGPKGMVYGASLGYDVGNLAKSTLNACFPTNSLKVKCNFPSLL